MSPKTTYDEEAKEAAAMADSLRASAEVYEARAAALLEETEPRGDKQ